MRHRFSLRQFFSAVLDARFSVREILFLVTLIGVSIWGCREHLAHKDYVLKNEDYGWLYLEMTKAVGRQGYSVKRDYYPNDGNGSHFDYQTGRPRERVTLTPQQTKGQVSQESNSD